MKRFFIITIALAAFAIGCTKSGILESPQTYDAPISFEPYTGKAPVTKASEVKTEHLWDAGFRVTGFVQGVIEDGKYKGIDTTSFYLDKKVYVASTLGEDGQKVYDVDDAGNKVWGYDDAMYWPEGKKLSFVAYGLNVNTGTALDNTDDIFKRTSGNYTSFSYTIPLEVANQKDLVISPIIQDKDRSSDNGRIPVHMYHVLSRVGFKVKAEGDAGIKMAIKNISMSSNFIRTATYYLTNAVTVSNSTVSYKFYPAKKTDTQVTYSLFDSDYTLGTTTGDPRPGFITTSSTTAVPIWKNCYFNPGNINPETLALPAFDEEGELVEPEEVEEGKEGYENYLAEKALYEMRLASIESHYMMIMPQEADNASLKVVYQLANAEEQEVDIPIGNFRFEPGKAYEFVFTLSTQLVGFEVDVNIWDPNNGDETNPETVPIDKNYPVTPTI